MSDTKTIEPDTAGRRQEPIVLLLERIAQAEKYKAGAWGRVVAAAKRWALLKAHGTYFEKGNMVHVGGLDRPDYEKHFLNELLRAAEDALIEEAAGIGQ